MKMKSARSDEKVREVSYYHTRIKDWPESERPREKLMKHGPGALTDAELLAILIGSGTSKVTAVDLAKRLLVEHKNLRELAGMSVGGPDLTALEKDFVKSAKSYSQRKGITYGAWREFGVPAEVLRKAGISRGSS